MLSMFEKLISSWRSTKNKELPPGPTPPAPKHTYKLADLSLSSYTPDPAALKIIQSLKDAGYEAYIVGGAIRDLILGEEPKDYDIVTNATPTEVRALFRRSRLIGRRFPIVHVFVGRQIIEVSTYRKKSEKTNQLGRITADNEFGTMDTDAYRRDFTCNALYFDPLEKEVISYHHALEDLRGHRLIMIGDPQTRVEEDPMRILRGIRIAQKLGLALDPELLATFKKSAPLLANEPSSRVFDEWVKILYSRHSLSAFYFLKEHGFLPYINPLTRALLNYSEEDGLFLRNLLSQSDKRLQSGGKISLTFVLAGLLWPLFKQEYKHYLSAGYKPPRSRHEAILTVLKAPEKNWEIPHRHLEGIGEIWRLQGRLENLKTPAHLQKVMTNGHFRAAYNFFLLRGDSAEVDLKGAAWWLDTVKKRAAEAPAPRARHRGRQRQKKSV